MSVSAVRTAPKYSSPWPRPFWPDAPELRRELVPNGNWYWRRQNLRHHFALAVIAGPANSRCGTEKQSAVATGMMQVGGELRAQRELRSVFKNVTQLSIF